MHRCLAGCRSGVGVKGRRLDIATRSRVAQHRKWIFWIVPIVIPDPDLSLNVIGLKQWSQIISDKACRIIGGKEHSRIGG